jgi:hypothetical protein
VLSFNAALRLVLKGLASKGSSFESPELGLLEACLTEARVIGRLD